MKKTIALLTAVILLAVACCSCGGSTKKTAEVVDIQLTSEEYAFAVDPNDAELLTKVNAFLLRQRHAGGDRVRRGGQQQGSAGRGDRAGL